jgi:DNA ligase-associated metallophosphoesterase
MLTIEWLGQHLTLDGRGGLFWTERRTLIIADPHFGKDAHFRQKAIPVPHGATDSDLTRLTTMIGSHAPARLVILGDFFHAAAGATSRDTAHALRAWRTRHPALEIELIRGNHDLHAGDPPADLGIRCRDEAQRDSPLMYRHFPPDQWEVEPHTAAPVADACLAGHVHPAITIRDGPFGLRARCFLFRRSLALLPAFGGFLGHGTIRPQRGDRIYVLNGEEVIELPTAAAS